MSEYVGLVLCNKEMAIAIAGLAHTAKNSTVLLKQIAPPEVGDPRVYPIEVVRVSRDGRIHEEWEVSPFPGVRPVLRQSEEVDVNGKE